MSVAIVTGATGLVGSEACLSFGGSGYDVVGIDNDMRRYFFGDEASTAWNRTRLEEALGSRYRHEDADIRDAERIDAIFQRAGSDISVVIHAAAQPSHDWAAKEPFTDFTVNASGTLVLLEAARRICPDAVFIFLSTNKVYGDTVNRLPMIEEETRWELDRSHEFARDGITEQMSVDDTLHSLFGASKLAADVLVQEYGRYFGLKTACFRAGCITGPAHAGAELHGFLNYLVKCAATGQPYTVFGYKAKQVRDNIHSQDLVSAFREFVAKPGTGEVYNIGGGRYSNCSIIEAIEIAEQATGRKMNWTYTDEARRGDHIWWVSSLAKFESAYPDWKLTYDVPTIIKEIAESNRGRWG